ncbi:MAG: hypothetical protein E4H09_01355 [Spirochaetales bacterium]|nr:MAG: hypothetical protein E4H09_01355 [Spirochaetales bacterium]
MNDFHRSLLTLGDDAFFELIRNYLGPIKTPFNKHDLIGQLQGMLRKPDTQERIVRMIDRADAELLSAVWLLNEPSYDDLISFFSAEQSYLDLHHRLLNIEDRLLVYRDGDRVKLNEILLPALKDRVLRAGWIFQAREREKSDPSEPYPWLTDAILASTYSYATERPELLKADGDLRKRSAAVLSERIPPLMESVRTETTSAPRALVLFQALFRLGAILDINGRIDPNHDAWHRLADLTTTERLCYIVSGWAADEMPSMRLAKAVEAVYTALPEDTAISPQSVERLLITLADDTPAELCRRAREGMELFGLLGTTVDGLCVVSPPLIQGAQRQPLIIQPNFDITVPQELPFADALFVARVALIKRHDTYSHYEITKDQLASVLRSGYDLDHITDRLREMTGGIIPQNVTISIQTWAHEFESLRLYEGVVLTTEEGRRHMIEHSREVNELIEKILAPGVYLLRRENVARLRVALEAAGVDMIPELPEPGDPAPQVPGGAYVQSDMSDRIEALSAVLRHPGSLAKPELLEDDLWKNEITETLNHQEMGDEQREDLLTRVERKLILSPLQLNPGVLKTEKTEARGLDYAGKVRIIEHAIRTGTSFLEIIERTSEGTPLRRLVEPTAVHKQGNDLVMIADELPARTEMTVMVSKLGLVRRIRAGLVKRRPTP